MTAAYTLSSGIRDRTGRVIGPRAERRRKAILTALETTLTDTPWRAVVVQDIARQVQCSMALFYLYFESLEEAFDVLCQQPRVDDAPLPPHLVLISELIEYERAMPIGDGAA